MSDNVIDAIFGEVGAADRASAARAEEQARAELAAEAAEPEFYRPYIARARPQMGFAVVEKNGTMHGFQYHTLRHPMHEKRDGEEYLSFLADGCAVVMQGKGLKLLFRALIRQTLAEAREYDGKPVEDISARIDRLSVADLGERADV